jgi:hypothetical protein
MSTAIEGITMLTKDALQSLALALDRILNGATVVNEPLPKRTNGFVLMVFPFGDENGQCHYVSNGASREDIIRLFTEQLRQLKAQGEKQEDIQ